MIYIYVRKGKERGGEQARIGGLGEILGKGGETYWRHWRKPFKRRRRKKHRKTSGDFLRIETSADFFFVKRKHSQVCLL